MNQREKYLRINNQNIYVKMMGSGDPILFLHGGPGDEHAYFLPHVEQLAEYFTLIFYDQRGCGRSEKATDPSDYSMKQEVEVLEEIRQSLGFETVRILGQSWGTCLGLLYATAYPEHVKKLMLVSAIGPTGTGYMQFVDHLLSKLSEDERKELEDLERKESRGEDTTEEIKQLLFPYYLYDLNHMGSLTPTKINGEVHSAMTKDIISNYDVTQSLSCLKDIPVLVVQGITDLITPDEIHESLVRYLPKGELITFLFSGHWPFVEEPERFIEVTQIFFCNKDS